MTTKENFTQSNVLELLQTIGRQYRQDDPLVLFKHSYVGSAFRDIRQGHFAVVDESNCIPLSDLELKHMENLGVGNSIEERLKNTYIATTRDGEKLFDFAKTPLSTIAAQIETSEPIDNFIALADRVKGLAVCVEARTLGDLWRAHTNLHEKAAQLPLKAKIYANEIAEADAACRRGVNDLVDALLGDGTASFIAKVNAREQHPRAVPHT